MSHTTLIDASTLHAHRNDPNWVVMDCRFSLAEPEAGRRVYRDSHLPGAHYAHLDEDLSDPITPTTGRHPLPDPERLAQKLGAWGIDHDTQVVAYDDMGGMLAAARLWWLLRWLGHTACAVLDGGLPAWRRAGLPLTVKIPAARPTAFVPRPDDRLWMSTEQVLTLSATEVLLDARAAARYRGEMEPIDPVAGHIPGALNLPTDGNLTPEGHFLPVAALRERFAAALNDRAPATVIHACGSGVTACHNLLAMEAAGLGGSRLYAGSWSEWIRDPQRAVAVGAV
ncbi:sulfurtransferase [Candidatus Competibacter phosphatis]|uniref:Sulfurtransferase n=1 Tax=Candidatus Competibacter phosphatis TaxID=221280 RepID=A0ABX1TKZ5_9GAMM|nr:sulfurtransferase [Candidatus Competibacter phosphatis]NMQ20082.1 sulfurtransferase [Candidatus Competibacter phosphatis]